MVHHFAPFLTVLMAVAVASTARAQSLSGYLPPGVVPPHGSEAVALEWEGQQGVPKGCLRADGSILFRRAQKKVVNGEVVDASPEEL